MPKMLLSCPECGSTDLKDDDNDFADDYKCNKCNWVFDITDAVIVSGE